MAVDRVEEPERSVSRPWPGSLAEALLAALHLPVLATDLAGRIFYCNPAAERFYGLSQEHLRDGNALDLLVGTDARPWADEIMAALVSGQSWSGEFPVRCAGGVVRQLLVTNAPLIEDGQVVGVMGVAEDITDRAGARDDASTYAVRLAKLAQITAELTAARDTHAVTDIVVTHAADAVEASVATVSLLQDDSTLALVAFRGGDPAPPSRWATYPMTAVTPATDSLRSGMPVILTGRAAIVARYPDLAGQLPDERSLICLPLQVAERPLGVIGLAFAGRRSLDLLELEFLTTLADTCAQALDRVDALAEARAAAARLSFLAEASAELATSLDYRATLANVARLAVPTLADWCAVEIVEDARLHTLAVAHIDPEKVSLARELQKRYSPDADAATGSPNVLRTGVSELYPEITEEMLVAGARDPEHLRMTRALQLHSALVVPLPVPGGRILGTITLIHAESGRRYSRADLAMAEDLGRRAAVAIDNSELHSQTRDAASLLQQAVLPDRLADVPGWEIAALYRPAGRTEVGGDFYDTIALGDDRLAVVIGDVTGRGVPAAAAMAHVRSALRAYVAIDPDPAAVLTQLDRMFATYDIGELVTVLYLVADVNSGRITMANAGHLPPLIVNLDGSAQALPVPPSLPLGAGPDRRETVTADMLPCQTVLLFTDGLIERRGEDIDVGLTRLAENAADLVNGDLAAQLAILVDRMQDPDRDDDVTAVALAYEPRVRGA